MRIVTWNMQRTRENWTKVTEFLEDPEPTAVLLQEAVAPPDGWDGAAFVLPGGSPEAPWAVQAGGPRSGGTAIVANGGFAAVRQLVPVPLEEWTGQQITASHPGAFTAAEVTLASGEVVAVVSFYAVWDRQDGIGIFSEATAHRSISDLTPLLQRPPAGGLVVAGDFNAYYEYGDRWDGRYMTVFSRLDAYDLPAIGPFGDGPLAGCPCRKGDECRHVQTYLHQKKVGNNPLQLDFVLANAAVRDRLPSVAPYPGARFDASDHLPVLLTLSL